MKESVPWNSFLILYRKIRSYQQFWHFIIYSVVKTPWSKRIQTNFFPWFFPSVSNFRHTIDQQHYLDQNWHLLLNYLAPPKFYRITRSETCELFFFISFLSVTEGQRVEIDSKTEFNSLHFIRHFSNVKRKQNKRARAENGSIKNVAS